LAETEASPPVVLVAKETWDAAAGCDALVGSSGIDMEGVRCSGITVSIYDPEGLRAFRREGMVVARCPIGRQPLNEYWEASIVD
jgi:hypothetical protein